MTETGQSPPEATLPPPDVSRNGPSPQNPNLDALLAGAGVGEVDTDDEPSPSDTQESGPAQHSPEGSPPQQEPESPQPEQEREGPEATSTEHVKAVEALAEMAKNNPDLSHIILEIIALGQNENIAQAARKKATHMRREHKTEEGAPLSSEGKIASQLEEAAARYDLATLRGKERQGKPLNEKEQERKTKLEEIIQKNRQERGVTDNNPENDNVITKLAAVVSGYNSEQGEAAVAENPLGIIDTIGKEAVGNKQIRAQVMQRLGPVIGEDNVGAVEKMFENKELEKRIKAFGGIGLFIVFIAAFLVKDIAKKELEKITGSSGRM